MLKNAYLLPKIGADTAENERNFAEILPKLAVRAPMAAMAAAAEGRPALPYDIGEVRGRESRRAAAG